MKPIYAASMLALAGFGLASCGNEAASPPAQSADAGVPGLTISDAALILPAVSGNPGVVYFKLANSSDRNLAVRTFEVEGAGRTEFHASMEMNGKMTMAEVGPQVVPAGGEKEFKPGGLHVMVFDIGDKLTAGGTTKMTVTVAGGAKSTFDLPVRAAGDVR